MQTTRLPFAVILLGLTVASIGVSRTFAAGTLTTDQKKELSQIQRDIKDAHSDVRRKKLEEADATLQDVEKRLKELAKTAQLPSNSKILLGPRKALIAARYALEMQRDPKKARRMRPDYVSFVRHIAPILQAKCIKCHGHDPSGELSMISYSAMTKGGESGPVLAVGNPARSLILLRICARDESKRMPPKREENPVTRMEVARIAMWISQGADFDGEDKTIELPELTAPKKELPPIKVNLPTGDETVSFSKDIAPIFVRECIRCHNKQKPEGELNLETFDSLIRGGKTGAVVLAGKPNLSRLFQLVDGAFEDIEMPFGLRLISPANRGKIKTWIAEGIKYDGGDVHLHLRMLNPSADEQEETEMASMTAEQFVAYREKRTADQWKKAFPDQESQFLGTDNYFIHANVPEERVQKAAQWADEHAEHLRELFGLEEGAPLWKGKLGVFILKDRADYEGFNQAILQRRIFPEVFGNDEVTSTQSEAFIIVQDTGDDSDETTPPFQFTLLKCLTDAYLKVRLDPKATPYPEWFSMGLGQALAAGECDRRDKYVEGRRDAAAESLAEIKKPEDVFDSSVFFSIDSVSPIGFTLVEFLLKRGREIKLRAFIESYEKSGNQNTSIMNAYRSTLDGVAKGYLSTIRPKKKKK